MSQTTIKKLLTLLKFALFFALFYILAKANINQVVFPFAFGALFALIWCNQKPILLSPLYLGATLLANPTEEVLIGGIATVTVCILSYAMHYKLQKRLSPGLLGFYALLSQSAYLYVSITGNQSVLLSGITVIGGTLFMFTLVKIFEAVLIKGLNFKLNLNELISAGILLGAISSGLSELQFFDIQLAVLFGAVLIPLSCIVVGNSGCFFISASLGIGNFLQSSSPSVLAAFSIWTVALCAVKSNRRVVSALVLLAADTLFVAILYGLDLSTLFLLTPSILGCFLLILIPTKAIVSLQNTFVSAADKLSMRNIVNRSRESLYRRFSELSNVFREMDGAFKKLSKGGFSGQQAKEMLKNEIKQKVCIDCPEKNRCHRVHTADINETFDILCSASLEKGKSTLLDVPPFLTARCMRINQILSTINQLTLQYKQYSTLMNNIDSSRLLIAEQLGGVGNLMNRLASEVKSNVSFDATREITLIDMLSTEGIDCHDVAVFEENAQSIHVTLVLKNEFATHAKIEPIASKVIGSKLSIVSSTPSPIGGFTILTLNTSPQYELLLGASCASKTGNQVCGDAYALTRLNGNRFLLALCDGMGSGGKAEKASNLAIGLIENFYKAGFDNELILSSVNKLLMLGNEEIFSALDLCVIDLQNGTADFVKLGSPCSLIKKKQEIEIIECTSLPIGIVNEMKPTVKKYFFEAGNIICLCSDGIADSFHTNTEFASFVNNLQTKNVQELANQILDKAIEACGGVALDDMTVLVGRIIPVK